MVIICELFCYYIYYDSIRGSVCVCACGIFYDCKQFYIEHKCTSSNGAV